MLYRPFYTQIAQTLEIDLAALFIDILSYFVFNLSIFRKLKKNVTLEKWEKALIKFCFSYSSEDGWELDR